MNKIYCIISHTHWDREWYMPFEKFRFKLVDLIDNVLDIVENYPEYIFHLDAQSIVLEDYLEIRPHKKEQLQKHIREERLLVGPWYVQNDFYLTSGESTIRNVIIGSDIAEKMGKCSWVGYTPDQFGLISQLPQIFNSFGIDNCVFGRGYHMFDTDSGTPVLKKMPSEFIWEGQDGSKVLAVNMPFWYNNAQRFSEDINKSLKLLEMIDKNFEGVALTPYLLLMNGVDHLEAQENLIPIIEKVKEHLPEDRQIAQYNLQNYIDSVKGYIAENEKELKEKGLLLNYNGELRNGNDHAILQGTLSSRIYLKKANVIAQNLLECGIEPIYSFMHMAGASERLYPSDFMRYLWKTLIQNHPHDSICGCSRDEVHDHMEDRYRRINEAGEELLKRGMDFISTHVSREGLDSSEYIVTVFNTIESKRSGVVNLELQFPVGEKVESFKIVDNSGNEIPYVITGKTKKSRGAFTPINLPGSIEVVSYEIQLLVENIEGLSYRTFAVKPSESGNAIVAAGSNDTSMENEYIKVSINADGKVDILYKETGKLYSDILMLEDSEDFGDSYVYAKASNGKTYTTEGLIPEIQCISNTGLEKAVKLTYNMQLPKNLDQITQIRSEELVENRVEVVLSLKKGCKWLDICFDTDNRSMDHRLRALIRTGIENEYTTASTPFDIISRDRRDVLKGIKNGTQPNYGFINIDGKDEGIAILNEGIHEYEHLLDDKGTIAVTLLRATEFIYRDPGSIVTDDTWIVPGNQCIRRINLRMAIYPHIGSYLEAKVATKTKEFQNPLLSYYQPVDVRKFMVGRAAVQDSEIKEIFYREDSHASLVLPREQSFIGIDGENIVLSAVKKAEKDNKVIIRLYNTSNEQSKATLRFSKPLSEAFIVNLKEEAIDRLNIAGDYIDNLVLKPKQIVTIAVR